VIVVVFLVATYLGLIDLVLSLVVTRVLR
jgi:preprotein translocase subunit SecE